MTPNHKTRKKAWICIATNFYLLALTDFIVPHKQNKRVWSVLFQDPIQEGYSRSIFLKMLTPPVTI